MQFSHNDNKTKVMWREPVLQNSVACTPVTRSLIPYLKLTKADMIRESGTMTDFDVSYNRANCPTCNHSFECSCRLYRLNHIFIINLFLFHIRGRGNGHKEMQRQRSGQIHEKIKMIKRMWNAVKSHVHYYYYNIVFCGRQQIRT